MLNEKKIVVGGVLTQVKIQTSRRGKQFALLSIEDFSGSGEAIVFSDIIEKRRMILVEGNTVVLFGTASIREGENPKIKGDDLTLLEAAPREIPLVLRIKLEKDMKDELPSKLLKEFSEFPGKSEVVFDYQQNGRKVIFKSLKYKIDLSVTFLDHLKELVGAGNISLVKR